MLEQCCLKCGTTTHDESILLTGGCVVIERNETCEIKFSFCCQCRDEFWSDFIGKDPVV
jgi:hypothetical protein